MTCTVVIEVESETKGFPQEDNKGEIEVKNASQDFKTEILRGCFILICCTTCINVIGFFNDLIYLPIVMIIHYTTSITIHAASMYYHSPGGFAYFWKWKLFWICAPIVRVRYETISLNIQIIKCFFSKKIFQIIIIIVSVMEIGNWLQYIYL